MADLERDQWLDSTYRLHRDKALAASALVGSVPIVAAIGVLHSRHGEGSLVYPSERIGKGMVPFTIHKFQSLRIDTPLTSSMGASDPRATRAGSLLRKTNLDELPQLYDILQGSMAFVGPRPLLQLDIDKMQAYLPRTRYDEWEEAYAAGLPGGISTYAVESRETDMQSLNDEQTCQFRADRDIQDYGLASPRHDRFLVFRALKVWKSTSKNYFR